MKQEAEEKITMTPEESHPRSMKYSPTQYWTVGPQNEEIRKPEFRMGGVYEGVGIVILMVLH